MNTPPGSPAHARPALDASRAVRDALPTASRGEPVAPGDARVRDELHRLLVACVEDYAIYAVTPDGRIATWNRGAERLKGYDAAGIVGQPLSLFYPAEARGADGVAPRAMELLATAARDGRAEDEGWRVRADGTRFWAHVVVTPVRDETDTLVGFAKVTRDLTDARRAEAQARQLAAEQAARAAVEQGEAEARLLVERLQEQAMELEAQTEEAQTLAEELEMANERIRQSSEVTEAARARAEALQRVTARLANARTIGDVGQLFSREITALLGADTTWVGLLTPDGAAVEALGWSGYPDEATAGWRRLPLEGTALSDVVRSGQPRWWQSADELVAAYPHREAVIRRARQEGVAVLPLLAMGDRADAAGEVTIGGFVVGFRAVHAFDDDTRAFHVALAQQCSQAIARALAFEAENAARARADAARLRAERLQALTAAFARAMTADDVIRAAVEEGGRVVGSVGGVLCVLDAAREEFTVVAGPGTPSDVAAAWRRFPMGGSLPAAIAVRTGAPCYSRSRDEVMARGGLLAEYGEQRPVESVASLPLVVGAGTTEERTLGVLSLVFDVPQPFDADDDTFLRTVADQCAQALDRAQLYDAEQAARQRAEAANRAKGEFLATMSHELRTPLNAIGGYAELIELGVHGPVTAAQLGALERIQRSQRALTSVINEVLNFARLEAGVVRYDMRVVKVMDTVADVESFILPQVRAKQLHLEVSEGEPGLAVHADAEKLGQVLLNLLSNAVKFTEPGGRITLRCAARPAPGGDGGIVAIAIGDTGTGIAPEQLERIFEPFVQVGRSLSRPTEGTGLGLAISRDLARAMGGELGVTSVAGEGSTFTLTLPRA